jgi:prevent-host-death family protein
MIWRLRDAKARLSDLVRRTGTEGAQTVTLRGKRVAVMVSAADYDRLVANEPNFVDALLEGPVWSDELVEAINNRNPVN